MLDRDRDHDRGHDRDPIGAPDPTGAVQPGPAPLPRFAVRPIGWVRRPGTVADPADFFDPEQETRLELLPRWAAGLAGIDDFSHLLVIAWLDRAARPRLLADPMRPEGRDDLPAVGLFATRSPRRPNPLGVACPRLLRREGAVLVVSGIDFWDGTPILDLKGYYPRDDARPDARVPDWLGALWQQHDAERGGEGGRGGTASLKG